MSKNCGMFGSINLSPWHSFFGYQWSTKGTERSISSPIPSGIDLVWTTPPESPTSTDPSPEMVRTTPTGHRLLFRKRTHDFGFCVGPSSLFSHYAFLAIWECYSKHGSRFSLIWSDWNYLCWGRSSLQEYSYH